MPAPTDAPGYVDMPSMSSGFRPASAIAWIAASTVSTRGSTMSRRPTRDIPMPVTATWSSNLSAFFGMGRKSWIFGSSAGNGPFSVSPVGWNTGIHTSSSCSKRTCTFMPTNTADGSQSTMLVVSRTRSSSSMATIAIRYGGGKLGIHICSLRVNPATTARPDTSAGAHSFEPQYGHTALVRKRKDPPDLRLAHQELLGPRVELDSARARVQGPLRLRDRVVVPGIEPAERHLAPA